MTKCSPECSAPPPGAAWCHCSTCHLDFRSDAAFDKHRTGPASDRRCMTVDEMLDAGMACNEHRMWVTKPWMPLPPGTFGPSSPKPGSQVSGEGSDLPDDSRAVQAGHA